MQTDKQSQPRLVKIPQKHLKQTNKKTTASSHLAKGTFLITEPLTLKTGRLELISLLIYVLLRQLHSEKLQHRKDLMLNMHTALRPPALRVLQRFHYNSSAPPLTSSDMPASLSHLAAVQHR